MTVPQRFYEMWKPYYPNNHWVSCHIYKHLHRDSPLWVWSSVGSFTPDGYGSKETTPRRTSLRTVTPKVRHHWERRPLPNRVPSKIDLLPRLHDH